MTEAGEREDISANRAGTQPPGAGLTCPSCGSHDVASILWGLRGPELDLEHPRKIIFAGCCITDEAPDFRCLTCEHAWQDPARHR